MSTPEATTSESTTSESTTSESTNTTNTTNTTSTTSTTSWGEKIRVVVGIDFGTTFTGFSYCHIYSRDNIVTNDQWPENLGQFKTNTVLQYSSDFNKVLKWGSPALARRASRRGGSGDTTKPIELFKLCLGNLRNDLKPKLPIEYKKAITDYLDEIGKLIKNKVKTAWENLDFFKDVLIVITVPAEYSEKERGVMRECANNAGLIDERGSDLLQFTTEPEAAAVYCMQHYLREHNLTDTNIEDENKETTFMIVDCGGGTVDLTTRKIIGKNVGEVTERSGDYCGSTFVDRAFLEYLKRTLGHKAIDDLRENNYQQLQYMVQRFCRLAKFLFTGDDRNFHYELDILDTVRDLQKYVTGHAKEMMEELDWLIDITFNELKSMFDPVVERIIKLIELQLENCDKECSIMFLVGGFSQSPYLQKRVKEKFKNDIRNISVPTHPIATVVRGATEYGLLLFDRVTDNSDNDVLRLKLTTRVLKFTYGVKIVDTWKNDDPIERKGPKGEIIKFFPIAKRGESVKIDDYIFLEKEVGPNNPYQTSAAFHLYCTQEDDVKYCKEEGKTIEYLGRLKINLPDVHLGMNRPLKFGLSFGEMDIKAIARNTSNGQNYLTTFDMNASETD